MALKKNPKPTFEGRGGTGTQIPTFRSAAVRLSSRGKKKRLELLSIDHRKSGLFFKVLPECRPIEPSPMPN